MKHLLSVFLLMGGLLAFSIASASVTYNVQWSGAGATPSNSATATGTVTFSTDPFGAAVFCYSFATCNITSLSITVSGASTGNGTFTLSDFYNLSISTSGALNTSTNLYGQPGFNDFSVSSGGGGAPSNSYYFTIKSFNGTGDPLVMTSMLLQSPPAPSAVPTAQAVPTLSEWAQLMLGLMVISMLGWQWRKQQN